ncbi:M1 family metallopeptidase [Desertivirga xinjiangensis]|uniref:M1 family metallopeptidase n=1 Tax=Desertivirga xinjiangensis TaxID=539206 RepID=UPI00210D71F0|nr:M1 family metallopeptidase [Pedobacter xinjiangensis]
MKKLFLFFCIVFFACQPKKKDITNVEIGERTDPHSFSEPDKAIVKHLDLELRVDFSSHTISGKATWDIQNVSEADSIVFDTHQLKIDKVTLNGLAEAAGYTLGRENKILGKALTIKITPDTKKVSIWYKTAADAAALQWLTASQTAGKKHPYLFTQSQAILARTWVPCQDSPGIRFTYRAHVSVPKELMAVMSAVNPQMRSKDGTYTFEQKKPIPSYLMSLAVGDIDFKEIDARTGIYAEPSVLQKAAWEFADMGKMVAAAEKIYGPYQWGRYDVLVLPPSFPFGGMENPMLTFATPTVLAGDRSLVNLIAHELAHSWSGNLVTNATWNDFWLNEGFTTYFERRIIEEVYGREEAEMQEVIGFNLLKATVAELGDKNDDTKLKGSFENRNPDDGVTDIAYEKGYSFLRLMEEAAGRNVFDAFVSEYFKGHQFKSIGTEDFVLYLQKNLIARDVKISDKVLVSKWIYEPGIPSNVIIPSSVKFRAIDSIIKSWDGSVKAGRLATKIKSTNERLYLISALPDSLSTHDLSLLDKDLGFTRSENTEIQCAWYTLALRSNYEKAYPEIEKYLINVGRRKLVLPLYKEMVKTEKGKKWAREVYLRARPNYHSVTFNTIDELLDDR